MGRTGSPVSRVLTVSSGLAILLFAACATHLERAKLHYSKGQEFARTYRTVEAAASYKRALVEAGKASGSGSSAQAFMIKGLAETSLERWADAETSFLRASALGFPEGQEWAADVSRLGLAISLAELGFEDAALRSLAGLLDRSTFKPVVPEAARRWLDLNLARAANMDDKERAKGLARDRPDPRKARRRRFRLRVPPLPPLPGSQPRPRLPEELRGGRGRPRPGPPVGEGAPRQRPAGGLLL